MKILIVNKFLYPNGGSETYIFEIGKCLESMGHEVQYFGMEHEGRIVGNHLNLYTRDMDFHGGGIRNKLAKLTYPFRIIRSKEAYDKISRILDDFKPDVVHFNNINFQLTPSVIEAVADHDIRNRTATCMVYTAHDAQWVCPNHLLTQPDGTICYDCRGCRYTNCIKHRCIHGSAIRSLIGALEAYIYHRKRTYDLVDCIIAPSDYMREKLEADPVLKGKCIVLHNFIPDNSGRDDSYIDVSAQDKEQRKYVLYFGRYAADKGIDTLLKAVGNLPDVDFVFAGSGPLESEIEKHANIENRGFTRGRALKELIAGAAFSVLPPIEPENCPFTVMESITYNTPVIASNIGGTPELLEHDRNGLLFEPGDAEKLTASIRTLWDDEELLSRLTQGCTDSRFMNVTEYCGELIRIYADNKA